MSTIVLMPAQKPHPCLESVRTRAHFLKRRSNKHVCRGD